jgi:hypothetical protein
MVRARIDRKYLPRHPLSDLILDDNSITIHYNYMVVIQ